MKIVSLSTIADAAIEALLDRAFGADRRTRTAYRLREGLMPIDALSFASIDADDALLATIQCWPVVFVGDDGARTAMVMVGPVAVEPAIQRGGIGQTLTRHMLAAADAQGQDALMLIGDPEYYGRFFGFSAEQTGRWRLPGPFEPHRLLARGERVPAGSGIVAARSPAAMRAA